MASTAPRQRRSAINWKKRANAADAAITTNQFDSKLLPARRTSLAIFLRKMYGSGISLKQQRSIRFW